jgi:hypothetical protein
MKKHSCAGLAVTAAMVASLAVGLGTATSARAGIADPTFQDNWPGQIEVDYRAADGTVQQNLQTFLPPNQQPAPIQPQFSGPWAAANICPTLQAKVAEGLAAKGYYLAKWDICWIQSTGDMQAAMVSPSQLELRWLVHGNEINFDVGGAPTTPTLDAKFDIEIDVLINAAGTIDGDDYNVSGTPLSLQSAVVRFPYADFSTHNTAVIIGKPSILGQAADALTSTVIDLSSVPGGPNLSQMITQANAQLHQAAAQISQKLVQPSTPGANQHFDFTMSVNSTNLILTLARDGTPPPMPTGCEWYGNQVMCDAHQPAGVYDLRLALAEHGSWYFTGAGTTLTNGTWSNQNYDGRPQLILADLNDGTYSVGVCSVNDWGRTCTPPKTVTLQTPAPGSPASGPSGITPGCTLTSCVPRRHAAELSSSRPPGTASSRRSPAPCPTRNRTGRRPLRRPGAVRDPQPVRGGRAELPLHQVRGPGCGRVRHRGADLPPRRAPRSASSRISRPTSDSPSLQLAAVVVIYAFGSEGGEGRPGSRSGRSGRAGHFDAVHATPLAPVPPRPSAPLPALVAGQQRHFACLTVSGSHPQAVRCAARGHDT